MFDHTPPRSEKKKDAQRFTKTFGKQSTKMFSTETNKKMGSDKMNKMKTNRKKMEEDMKAIVKMMNKDGMFMQIVIFLSWNIKNLPEDLIEYNF